MKERFDAIQVLRAIAATLVVFEHALFNWASKATLPGSIPSFPHLGDYGVKLFFCISGFIIVHTAYNMPAGWESTKTFWRRRIQRIVPLYWIVTTVYLLKLLATGHGLELDQILKSYLFIPYVNAGGLVQPLLGQGWSLNYEMLFYLTFGALFFLPRRWHALTTAGLITLLAGARAFGWLENADTAGALYHWADSVILYFVAGVLACLVAKQWRAKKWPAFSQGTATLVAAVIVAAFAGFALPHYQERAYAWMPLACIAPLLICITAPAGAVSTFWQPAIYAGDASYSTYLTHGFVMGPLATLLGGLSASGSLGYYGFAWICVLLCTGAGYLVFVGVEQPLSKGRSVFRWGFGKLMNRAAAR